MTQHVLVAHSVSEVRQVYAFKRLIKIAISLDPLEITKQGVNPSDIGFDIGISIQNHTVCMFLLEVY